MIGLGDGLHLFGGSTAVSFPTAEILEVSVFSITEGQERKAAFHESRASNALLSSRL